MSSRLHSRSRVSREGFHVLSWPALKKWRGLCSYGNSYWIAEHSDAKQNALTTNENHHRRR